MPIRSAFSFSVARAASIAALLLIAGCAATTPPPAPAEAGTRMSDAQLASLMDMADRASAAGDSASAERYYGQVVQAYPDSADVWFRLGTSYLRSNQPDLAVIALREAVRNDQNMTKAWANLSIAHLQQFRQTASRAVAGNQLSEANRIALNTLLSEVEGTLAQGSAAPSVAPSAARQAPAQ